MSKTKMNRAIKYQIYPSEEQRLLIEQTFGCVRKVYNMGLEMNMGLYDMGYKTMSTFDLKSYCNKVWKKEFDFLRKVDKFALENSLFDLGTAYTNFFQNRAAYPKFKSRKKKKQSYTTNITNNNIAIIYNGKYKDMIKLPKLGKVSAFIYRSPESDWIIKSATISRNSSGNYFVSLLFEFEIEIPDIQPDVNKAIGLDYSSPNFYVDSNGKSPEVPHAYRKAEKVLAREQRRLARMTKGSKNYEKQRIVIAKIHAHIANQRKNFCHTESRKIVNSYDIVCVEDLDLHAQAQTLNFGKAVADNGFGMFRTFLEYKLKAEGKLFVKIDRMYPSTKTCHNCGGYNPNIKLGDQVWLCPHCGRILLRDHNAALNIRDEGLRMLGLST